MKIYEWDIVNFHATGELKEITTEGVAFTIPGFGSQNRYTITYNENNQLVIYKSGFHDDKLTIIAQGANKIAIY